MGGEASAPSLPADLPRNPLAHGVHPANEAGTLIVHELLSFQSSVTLAGALSYLLGLFLYSMAAAVFLPIPVEPLLLLLPEIDLAIKAIVLGLGKAVGAIVIFHLGFAVNRRMEVWMQRHPRAGNVLNLLERFVRKTRWPGLMVLLAIPFMSDTAANYFYSLLNEEGRAVRRWQFVLANFVGGVARAYLFLLLLPWVLPG
jgi:membrane protein YqaA with SNARE-associated domain